jgi:hypothetical protein
MMTVVFECGGKENETRTRIAYNTSNTFNTTLLITSLCAATATTGTPATWAQQTSPKVVGRPVSAVNHTQLMYTLASWQQAAVPAAAAAVLLQA